MTDTPITIPPSELSKLSRALPFWLSLGLLPLVWVSALYGGWTLVMVPVATWYLFTALDAALGLNTDNADLAAQESDMFWYRMITIIWAPAQFLMLACLLWYVPQAEHLSTLERIGVFFGVGVITGTVGINYSHELMHQKNKLERWMADLLLGMVLYSHFRSEHLLVHHRYVGTPRDPVTARYNEGFHRYYPRVLIECLVSGFGAEKAMLARKNLPWTDRSNPFWRYWGLQIGFLILALVLGGWSGVGLFLVQAGVAEIGRAHV